MIYLFIGAALLFLGFILFLLKYRSKKQSEILNLPLAEIAQTYLALPCAQGRTSDELLVGFRKDETLTRYSLFIRSMTEEITKIDFATINRSFSFQIQNRKYHAERKATWNSQVKLYDESGHEISSFETRGLLGLKHRFLSKQTQLESKVFISNLSAGFQYRAALKDVGFCVPLFGRKDWGQVLVMDHQIPMEVRVFILAVVWKGL